MLRARARVCVPPAPHSTPEATPKFGPESGQASPMLAWGRGQGQLEGRVRMTTQLCRLPAAGERESLENGIAAGARRKATQTLQAV